MYKIFFLLCIFVCVGNSIYSQTPAITINSLDNACLNTVYKIPVTITGNFDAGNVFKVRVRRNQYEAESGELPATLVNGKIEVVLTDPVLLTFPGLQLRVISTAPSATSQYSSSFFKVHSRGNISISNSLTDTINKYEPFVIAFSSTSNSPGYITLKDSTRFDFFGSVDSPLPNFTRSVYPENSGTYSIAHAENFCGAMVVDGQARVAVNPISVRTTQLSPASLCPGSELRVDFSTEGIIQQSAKYTVRLTEIGATSNPSKYELPAVFRNGALYATIPGNLNLIKHTSFSVNILVANPNIVGNPGDRYIMISPKPIAEVISPNTILDMGNSVKITVRYSGPTPHTINMTDGTNLVSTNYVSSVDNYDLYRSPIVTTDYAVKSIESACQQSQLPASSMRVTVMPGLHLDKIDTERNYCEGEIVRMHFISNVAVPATAVFTMDIGFRGAIVSVPAKRDGEFVEFKIPAFANDPVPNYNRNKSFSFQLLSENPSLKSFRKDGITIQSKPTIAWINGNLTSFPGPATTTPNFFLIGGGPYDVTFKDRLTYRSSIYDVFGSARFYVPSSGSYGIESIANSCFTNSDLPQIDFKVENPLEATPKISIIPGVSSICYTDSLEVDINTSGNFATGNTFQVQMTNGSSSQAFNTFATVNKTGKLKINIPTEGISKLSSGTAHIYIRIASTSPVVYSEYFTVILNFPLSQIYLNYSERENYDYQKLEQTNTALIQYLGGTPSSLVYSDGKQDYTVLLSGQVYSSYFPFNSNLGANTYTLKTITSVCGTQELNLPMSVLVLPYRISISPTNYQFLCTGSTITIPFSVLDAQPSSATFSLQIEKNKDEYIEIGKGTSLREITGTIPADFPYGGYSEIRIVSGDGVISDAIRPLIGAAPTGTISAYDRIGTGPVSINAGISVGIQISLTGSKPHWLVADGWYNHSPDFYPVYYSVSPSRSGQYMIRSLRNACGYGTFQGSVEVKVLPTLKANPSNNIQCAGGQFLINYSLTGDFDLKDDYIRFDLVNEKGQTIYKLDSTKIADGSQILKVPTELVGGNYTIVTYIKKYGVEVVSYVQLMTKPNVTLLGSTTINPGDQTNLFIRHNGYINANPISYQLSNGYSGEFSEVNPTGASPAVSPAVTTEYTLVAVSNQCGQGVFSGKAIVEVNPPSEKRINVISWKSVKLISSLCTQDSIRVYFSTIGTFSPANRFTVQISDSTGQNFKSITTTGNTSPLTAIIPGTTSSGIGYRLRVIASDQGTTSSAFKELLVLKSSATARFSTDLINYMPGKNPKVAVLLAGDAPYSYVYGTELARHNRYSSLTVDSLVLNAAPASLEYKLFSVSNGCGAGTIGAPSTVRLEIITGLEDLMNQMVVTLMPNPTNDFVTLKFSEVGLRKASVYSIDGKLLLRRNMTLREEVIDFRNISSGVFVLRIESGNLSKNFRVIRQ